MGQRSRKGIRRDNGKGTGKDNGGEYNHNTLYTCMKLSNIKILTFNILDYGISEGFQVMDYIQNSIQQTFLN